MWSYVGRHFGRCGQTEVGVVSRVDGRGQICVDRYV